MNYNPQQFQYCLFNPLEKALLKTYPDLSEVSSDERLLRYIISMYDPKSHLVRLYSDIRMRKHAASLLAGYDLKKDDDLLQRIYSMEDEGARGSITRFLTQFAYPRDWFMICANEQTLYEFGQRLMKPIEEDENAKEKDLISAIAVKSTLSKEMREINERIEAGYKKLFGADEDLSAIKINKITPESMASKV